METINNIELRDESIYPDKQVLKSVLGDSYTAYLDLLKIFDNNEMQYEWRYYHDGKTWLCKVQKKKKTVVWMSAWKGFMQATIYIPEKYIDAIYTLNICEERKEKIRQTKNTGKSKPCIFEIRNMDILEEFNEIMQFKLIINNLDYQRKGRN